MINKILMAKRFALFAPFVGLAFITLIAFIFWHVALDKLTERLAAQGLSWQQISRQGFPARLTLELEKPRWRQDDILWRNTHMSLTTMPFNGAHAIIDFIGPHEIETAKGNMTLAHQGNLMSLVGDAGGLVRGSFEAQSPEVSGQWNGRTIAARSDVLGLHMRRNEADATRHDIALVTKNLSLPARDETISRLDIAASAPTAFFENGPAIGHMLMLERMTATRGAVTLIARGRVKLRQNGEMDGRLDLDVVNLSGFIDGLIELGLLAPRNRQRFLLLGGLGAALGGDTQDRISLPLNFANGRMFLGPIEIGRAPRWQ